MTKLDKLVGIDKLEVAPAEEATTLATTPPSVGAATAEHAEHAERAKRMVYCILRKKTRALKQNVIDVYIHHGAGMRSVSRDIALELGLPYEETFHGVITTLSPKKLIQVYAQKVWGEPDRFGVQVL